MSHHITGHAWFTSQDPGPRTAQLSARAAARADWLVGLVNGDLHASSPASTATPRVLCSPVGDFGHGHGSTNVRKAEVLFHFTSEGGP